MAGCSSGTPADDVTVDAKAGLAAPVAPPGRYRTLFEPCGTVPQAVLKEMLPGAAALPDPERDRTYRGTAAVTYDTDRRVGCSWRADTPETSHRLSLDVERVVSYDTAVSDDARAQEVYVRKQLAAGIPLPPTAPPEPTGTPGGTTGPTGTATTPPAHRPTATGGATPPSTAPTPTGSASTGPAPSGSPDSTGLEPRVLEGLGEVAYLDDVLGNAGANSRQRSVSVVFRTSNVIVTVSYREEITGSSEAPDSTELQERARKVARLLADRLDE
ncbi:lipoprotein [Streptomyces sp. NRRL F-6491]|nr:lipoprotein [Streptomyces sp. NRRL F-6491]KOX51362.1 lipoprotein [Streptomyces sp. NRRL F-6492]